jgi:hypothetical protein
MGLLPAAALAVLGTGMQMAGARKSAQAQDDAYAQQLTTQQGHKQEGAQLFNQTLNKSNLAAAGGAIQEGTGQRLADYNSPVTLSGARVEAPGGASTTSKQNQITVEQQKQARAKLGGYGDWLFNNAIMQGRSQQGMNQVSSFAGGDARLFPLMLQDAGRKGDNLSGLGALLSAVSPFANYMAPKKKVVKSSPYGYRVPGQ